MSRVIGSREVEDSAAGYCCRGMEDSAAIIIKKGCYGVL